MAMMSMEFGSGPGPGNDPEECDFGDHLQGLPAKRFQRGTAVLMIALLAIVVLQGLTIGPTQFLGEQGWASVLGNSVSQGNPNLLTNIRKQINFGFNTDKCFCLGNNKNFNFLSKINEKEKFFKEIVPLEHPRFIMQYRYRRREEFVNKFIMSLRRSS